MKQQTHTALGYVAVSATTDDISTNSKQLPAEYKLIKEVLIRAWKDLKHPTEYKISRDAYRWFLSDSVEPFSCRWIMYTLNWHDQRELLLAAVKRHYLNVPIPAKHSRRLSYERIAGFTAWCSNKSSKQFRWRN